MDKKKILIVDDEPEFVKAIQIRLEWAGYEVLAAFDGQEGLQKARSAKPDVMLLDISMPKMTGEEVLIELKNGEDTKSIPVIMITAKHEVDDVVKYMTKYGAKDFIVKPFLTEDFLSKIYASLYENIDKKVKKTIEEEEEKKQ